MVTRVERVLITVFVAIISLLAPGCWDGVELQQRAIVLMIGLDPVQTNAGESSQQSTSVAKSHAPDALAANDLAPGKNPSGRYRVTIQLALPHRLGIPPSSSSGSSGDNSSTLTISEQGNDVSEALRKIQLSVNRKLFYGLLQAIVINRKIAEEGTLTILNPLVQSRVISRNVSVFISASPTEEFMQKSPALDIIPGMYLSNFFRNRVWINRPYDATVGGFHQRLATPGIEPYALTIVQSDPQLSSPEIIGIAVFLDDKFVGYLTGSDYIGWSMVDNQFPPSTVPYECPTKPGKRFVVDVKSTNCHADIFIRNASRVPSINVHVLLRGTVEGGPCVTGESPRDLQSLESAIEEQTADMIANAIRHAQTCLHSDVFGFGRELYRHHPGAWRGEAWWRSAFPNADVHVEVQARVEYVQTYGKSELVYR